MGLYFCFGILYCFICLITIPKFTFGMHFLDEETFSDEIDPNEAYNKETDIMFSEIIKNETEQDKYPISIYFSKIMLHYLRGLVDDEVNGHQDAMNEFYDDVRDSKKYNEEIGEILRRLLDRIVNEKNKRELIKEYISCILRDMKNDEADLKRNLREVKIKNNGTIKINYVTKIMENPFLRDLSNSETICKLLTKKKLEHLVGNFLPIIEDDEDVEYNEYDKDN
ncbi:uncharacterized protein LOC126909302 [Daktulosphaira vitifoliae]|uniref:uncharacterized protein LOC126909302 n=1 Tax=Daktulosphaira vitifoliae TaxID=58002 RepID=UPI0021A9D556|nr:uncharacterized protein LOC126909302 [Daktulosphaira vitifoliae]